MVAPGTATSSNREGTSAGVAPATLANLGLSLHQRPKSSRNSLQPFIHSLTAARLARLRTPSLWSPITTRSLPATRRCGHPREAGHPPTRNTSALPVVAQPVGYSTDDPLLQLSVTRTMAYQPPNHHYYDERDVSPIQQDSQAIFPPQPPPHRDPVAMDPNAYSHMQGQQPYQNPNNYSDYSPPETIAGDNVGGGAINGIADPHTHGDMNAYYGAPSGVPPHNPNTPFADAYAYDSPTPPRPIHSPYNNSSQSLGSGPFGAAGAGMYSSASSMHSSQRSAPLTSPTAVPYSDNPYTRYSSSHLDLAPQLGAINPNEVADDDDWGMTPTQQNRRSLFGAPAAATGAGAAAGAAAAAGTRDGSGGYDTVPTGDNAAPAAAPWEKSQLLAEERKGRKKTMWIVIAVIAIVVGGAVLGGVLGTVLNKHGGSNGSGGSSGSANAVAEDNKNDLSIDSDEIKSLMNNKNLHKVFPGMDYTPLNAQYPDCMHVPPSQNNITRDMAVMSQLTNAVRLYGTDCNQTEMVLHAIDRLQLTDMKVWLGVWLGNNHTTNTRQVDTMWQIIDDHVVPKWKEGKDHPFKGVIVGNEVLFRKDLTKTELIGNITDIRDNITALAKKYSVSDAKLPIALSDLGDNWTADMATKVDVVMSNVHPFFAGVEVDKAAEWTWDFWTTHDVALTANDNSIKQVIAEVGWPTGGGNDCGSADCTSDTQGSIAGVSELNQFMEEWICPSMKNGTEYFWYCDHHLFL